MNYVRDYYHVIADIDELRWFYDHAVKPPKRNEAYAFCLSFRNKKLTEEERKELCMPRSEMLDPVVIMPHADMSFSFKDFLGGVAKYEVNKNAFTTRNGKYYLEKTLVCYFHINPCDELKVVKDLKEYINVHEQELIDSAMRDIDRANEIANIGNDLRLLTADKPSLTDIDHMEKRIKALDCRTTESGTSQSLYKMCKSLSKMKRLQFDNVGSKYWVDFDMDLNEYGKSIREEIYTVWYNYCIENLGKGNFIIIQTGGGYHTMVNKEIIHWNPNKFINNFMNITLGTLLTAQNYIDELVYNTNAMIPVPGSYQYGKCVRVLNKEDF